MQTSIAPAIRTVDRVARRYTSVQEVDQAYKVAIACLVQLNTEGAALMAEALAYFNAVRCEYARLDALRHPEFLIRWYVMYTKVYELPLGESSAEVTTRRLDDLSEFFYKKGKPAHSTILAHYGAGFNPAELAPYTRLFPNDKLPAA